MAKRKKYLAANLKTSVKPFWITHRQLEINKPPHGPSADDWQLLFSFWSSSEANLGDVLQIIDASAGSDWFCWVGKGSRRREGLGSWSRGGFGRLKVFRLGATMRREKLATRWSGGRTDFEETFLSIDPDWGPRWDFDAEDIEYIKAWFGLYIQRGPALWVNIRFWDWTHPSYEKPEPRVHIELELATEKSKYFHLIDQCN